MKFRIKTYKKIIAIVIIMLCIIPQSAVAQRRVPNNLPNYNEQPYHFGFILAFNQMSFNIDYKYDYQRIRYSGKQSNNSWDPEHWQEDRHYYVVGVESSSSPGFTVGITGSLRLAKYFDLRLVPTLSFGRRDLKYFMYCEELDGDWESSTNGYYVINGRNSVWDNVIVEFPLHLKYKSKRFNNFGAYIIGGANLKLDATGRKNTNKTDDNQIIKIKTKLVDVAAELGAGVDFYNSYFKFGIEVKMGWGLTNVLINENQILDGSFDKLRNNTFQISLTFE